MEINDHIYDLVASIRRGLTKTAVDDEAASQLLAMYGIDVKKLRVNNSDKALVEEVLMYGLAITRIADNNTLEERSRDNIVCRRLYNVMRSYKYIYLGFIHDALVYKRFNYFYIDNHTTNTGRFVSNSYFIQLQGLKAIQGFINFHKVPEVNDIQLKSIMDILRENIRSLQTSKTLATPIEYKKQVQLLMAAEIKARCNLDTDRSTYPYKDGTPEEQLIWLAKHVKKPDYIYHIRSLLNGLYSGNFYHKSYEKDATSSGIQISSMLLRDKELASQTNLIEIKREVEHCSQVVLKTTYAALLKYNNGVTAKIREIVLAPEKEMKERLKKHREAILETLIGEKLSQYYFYIYIQYEKDIKDHF
jgi:hypothetical protein